VRSSKALPRALPLAFLLACEPSAEGSGNGGVGLDLALAADASVAGEAVGFTTVLHLDDGSEVAVAPEMVSDAELHLATRWTAAGAGEIAPTAAGIHLVTAAATWQGKTYYDTAWLAVSRAEAASLDLSLSGVQVGAGEPLSFDVSAFDAFGNEVPDADVLLAADSPDVVIADPRIASGVPGIYAVTASVDALSDREEFRVVAGEAEYIDLSLSTTDLEVYETTIATAYVKDPYGNTLDAAPEIAVSGTAAVVQAGPNITFPEEGWYTVTATHEDLSAAVGPFLIDSTGPDLDIYEPARADWEINSSALMSGKVTDRWSDVALLTVNGNAVPVNGDGSFTHTLDYAFGLNVVDTYAEDTDGNSANDTRTVLDGPFAARGSGIGNGIVARVNEDGFDTIEGLGESLLADFDLASMLTNPVVSMEEEDCYDIIFDEICVTWYAIDMYVWNPSIGATDMELDPTAGGYIDTTFTVYDPYIEWEIDATLVFVDMSAEGTVYADSITANMDLYPYVSSGVLGISVGAVDVTSSNFTFYWDSWIYDLMSWFGLDLSSMVQSLMEDAVESAVTDEVPAAIEDALADLEIATSFEVGSATVDLVAEPFAVSVDDLGLTLGLATYVDPQTWVHEDEGLGSLYAAYGIPSYTSASPGFQVSIGEDFLNQAMYAFWGAGVLDQDLGGGDLGLDLGSFGDILGIGDLHITTKALLPPVILPGSGTSMMDIQIGDLELSLYDGEAVDENLRMRVYVTILGGLDLDVSDGLLAPTLGDTEVRFDVVVPAANTVASQDTEDLLEALIPLLLPSLTGAIGEIPIPELGGFGISIGALRLDGPENGFVTVDADLSL